MTAVDLGMPALPLRQQRRSVSQITSYSTCSEEYRLNRIEQAPSRPAAWFHTGSSGGIAIEEWENSGRKTKLPELIEMYYTDYDARIAKDFERVGEDNYSVFMTGGARKAEDDIQIRRELGVHQITDYIDYALREKHLWRVVESEFKLEGEIAGVKMLGWADQVRIDLTDDSTPYVADLKSGKETPEEPIQLAVYDYLLRQQVGTTTTGFADFIHLGRPEMGRAKAKPTVEVRHQMDDWPVERLEAWVLQMDQSEKAGVYLPSTAKGCARTCGVSQWCRSKGDWISVQQYLPVVESSTSNKESA